MLEPDAGKLARAVLRDREDRKVFPATRHWNATFFANRVVWRKVFKALPLKRMAVIGIARQCCRVQHELTAGGAGIGGSDRDLDPEFIRRPRLALADALHFRGME
jgi:hypothetical protein